MSFKIDHNKCRSCCKCCQGDGWVYVNQREQKEISLFLKIEQSDFLHQYTLKHDSWVYLRAKENKDKDCILLEKQGCSVYPVRPKQCKDFPEKWKYEDMGNYCGCRTGDIR